MGRGTKAGLLLILFLFVENLLVAASFPLALQRFQFSQAQMGTLFTITVYAPSHRAAFQASTKAFARARELNQTLSHYSTESELNRLARQPETKVVAVSADLFRILKLSREMAILSDGAFDVTLGPLIQLWRRSKQIKRLPTVAQLRKAKENVGFLYMEFNAPKRTIRLKHPNMQLDLGGIGKGYALDEMLKVLKNNHIYRALLVGGGDVLAGLAPPGTTGWKVGAVSLGSPKAPNSFLFLKNAAISISGDTEQYVEIEGRRYSHIVDPKTGVGLKTRKMVCVYAINSVTADSLATALSVMPTEEGLSLAKSLGAAARVMEKAGEQVFIKESKDFPKFIQKPISD